MTYDLIVITSYPRQGTTRDKYTVGVADYAKQTLLSFPSDYKILVLAEILPSEPTTVVDKNITIIRCWQRQNFFSLFKLFPQLIQNHSTSLLIEFEMAMFGSPLINIFLPKLLLFSRIIGKKPIVVLHQVVLNFNEIAGHMGQSQDSPINTLLNFLAKIFYKLIILLSSKIKDRLDKDNDKIVVIPHGVENKFFVETPKTTSSSIFVVTVFGYLAWYKGTDWIVKVFTDYFSHHPKSKLRLIIAGGPNPNHLDKPYYQKYLADIQLNVSKYPYNMSLTGFVDESKIAALYQNSDLIVLPYRVGMSSSGPLSIAFSYHKPFLVSPKISPILDTADIKNILDKKTVEFSFNSKDLLKKIISLQKNPQKLQALSLASQKISQSRDWQNIAKSYLACFKV